MKVDLENLNFDDRGLIPAVLQDVESRKVLMVAYMNREALVRTLETGKAWFYSRSRQKLWLKGETSGNYQLVKEIRIDCDSDTLLVLVKPEGPACHTGHESCFYRNILTEKGRDQGRKHLIDLDFIKRLFELIKDRKINPTPGSYTSYLFREGIDKVCKKIGEEAAEVIIGAKNKSKQEVIYESADLIYHLLVLMVIMDTTPGEVINELKKRHKE
ncbi:bifunctional phosphoribosyl-AMP cyclohydrolase/phosphoribosyl-ATP diphosphatase HisIE [Halothermothrix orenii]|uniref:Histidine biosynthesis bifunctional protein HisIE n=1 Tax=Halothermothrix orenii (strain H 168 / OCM 544 / DSM 9562) TaxID=373903 RepID=B8D117_HALOH|nr:bifunctional phosphoribosyl-AMP cyclohydrolase/phosphoribosyl-ATP diphosphatase HisIE [Halothermothrix orenii]ACL68986.1 phosphoribosyl-AMP cyclohydrolase;Phosphoribosyl-ATP diphosphatase [Halothermothrix orenii H 168]